MCVFSGSPTDDHSLTSEDRLVPLFDSPDRSNLPAGLVLSLRARRSDGRSRYKGPSRAFNCHVTQSPRIRASQFIGVTGLFVVRDSKLQQRMRRRRLALHRSK